MSKHTKPYKRKRLDRETAALRSRQLNPDDILFWISRGFKKKPRRWREIADEMKVKRSLRRSIKKSFNRFSTGSDYRLVRAKIKINLGTERKKLIHQKRFPTILELQQNVDPYQRNIKSNLPSIFQMNKMNLDELEQKIRNSMLTATKQICSRENPKGKKPKKPTRRKFNKYQTQAIHWNPVYDPFWQHRGYKEGRPSNWRELLKEMGYTKKVRYEKYDLNDYTLKNSRETTPDPKSWVNIRFPDMPAGNEELLKEMGYTKKVRYEKYDLNDYTLKNSRETTPDPKSWVNIRFPDMPAGNEELLREMEYKRHHTSHTYGYRDDNYSREHTPDPESWSHSRDPYISGSPEELLPDTSHYKDSPSYSSKDRFFKYSEDVPIQSRLHSREQSPDSLYCKSRGDPDYSRNREEIRPGMSYIEDKSFSSSNERFDEEDMNYLVNQRQSLHSREHSPKLLPWHIRDTVDNPADTEEMPPGMSYTEDRSFSFANKRFGHDDRDPVVNLRQLSMRNREHIPELLSWNICGVPDPPENTEDIQSGMGYTEDKSFSSGNKRFDQKDTDIVVSRQQLSLHSKEHGPELLSWNRKGVLDCPANTEEIQPRMSYPEDKSFSSVNKRFDQKDRDIVVSRQQLSLHSKEHGRELVSWNRKGFLDRPANTEEIQPGMSYPEDKSFSSVNKRFDQKDRDIVVSRHQLSLHSKEHGPELVFWNRKGILDRPANTEVMQPGMGYPEDKSFSSSNKSLDQKNRDYVVSLQQLRLNTKEQGPELLSWNSRDVPDRPANTEEMKPGMCYTENKSFSSGNIRFEQEDRVYVVNARQLSLHNEHGPELLSWNSRGMPDSPANTEEMQPRMSYTADKSFFSGNKRFDQKDRDYVVSRQHLSLDSKEQGPELLSWNSRGTPDRPANTEEMQLGMSYMEDKSYSSGNKRFGQEDRHYVINHRQSSLHSREHSPELLSRNSRIVPYRPANTEEMQPGMRFTEDKSIFSHNKTFRQKENGRQLSLHRDHCPELLSWNSRGVPDGPADTEKFRSKVECFEDQPSYARSGHFDSPNLPSKKKGVSDNLHNRKDHTEQDWIYRICTLCLS